MAALDCTSHDYFHEGERVMSTEFFLTLAPLFPIVVVMVIAMLIAPNDLPSRDK